MTMANLDQLKDRVPDHAKDLRINLGVITSTTVLTPVQAWTIAVTCANATRVKSVIDAVEADAQLLPEELAAARGAAAIMAMNNVYYRFVHFTGDEYKHMPARLRMQLIGSPGIAKLDFELACLAASAIAGCETCMRSHDASARERGATKEMIQDAVRIAAVLNGVATALSRG